MSIDHLEQRSDETIAQAVLRQYRESYPWLTLEQASIVANKGLMQSGHWPIHIDTTWLPDEAKEPPKLIDIYPYLEGFHDRSAVGGIVYLSDGEYSLGGPGDAGQIRIDKGRTSKIILQARTQNGVKVNMAAYGGTQLEFGNGTGTLKMNLGLTGIDFNNGNITIDSCTDMDFWHSRYTFTRRAWYDQVVAEANKLNYYPTSCDRDPFKDGRNIFGPGIDGCGLTFAQWRKVADAVSMAGPVRVQGSTGASMRIGFHGVDIDGSYNDGLYFAGTFDLLAEGMSITDVSEYENGVSVDVGWALFGTPVEDQFHNDAIQIGSHSWRPVIRDTYIAGRIMWNQTTHPSKMYSAGGKGWQARFERIWSGGQRWTPTSGRGYKSGLIALFESTEDHSEPGIVIAAGTVTQPSLALDHSGVINDFTYIRNGAGQPISWVTPESNFKNLIRTNIRATNLGMANTYDQKIISAHPDNPANLWRTKHPYGSYAA